MRNRVSDLERFSIIVPYELNLTGNLEKAQETAETWAEIYTREASRAPTCRGSTRCSAGLQKSRDNGRMAVAFDPTFPPGWKNLASSYLLLGDLQDAEKHHPAGCRAQFGGPRVPDLSLPDRVLKGRSGRNGARCVRGGDQRRGAPLGVARTIRRRSRIGTFGGGADRSPAKYWTWRYRRLISAKMQRTSRPALPCGKHSTGMQRKRGRPPAAALDLSHGRNVEYGVAFVRALTGDIAGSQALALDLDKRFPDNTYVRFTYLPTLKALSALSHGDPSAALDELQTAAPYEFAVSGSGSGSYGTLSAVYLRGLALPDGASGAGSRRGIPEDHRSLRVGPLDPVHVWRACNWRERSGCRETPPGPKPLTGISSSDGKAPTRAFPS